MPLMHGSTSPSKNGWPPSSQRQLSRTSATGLAHLVTSRVHPEVAQQEQAVRRGGPGLASRRPSVSSPLGSPSSALGTLGREVRAARPLAVLVPQRQQPGAPALGRHPRPLRRHDLGRRVRKIPQHLPADRRVGVEQPVQDGHTLRLRSLCLRAAALGKIDEASAVVVVTAPELG